MLERKNRISKKLFDEVFRKGRVYPGNGVVCHVLISTKEEKLFAVVVPKKVSKSAVSRNRIRRIGYSAIQKMLPEIEISVKCVCITKKIFKTRDEIIGSLEEVFTKAKILRNK